MTILAVSGSLRAASSNTNLLRAAAILAPEVTLYEGLGTLPPFNPDLDGGSFSFNGLGGSLSVHCRRSTRTSTTRGALRFHPLQSGGHS